MPLGGSCGGVRFRIAEIDHPFAGDNIALDARRRKLPVTRGGHGQAGEISAGTWRIEFRLDDAATRIDVNNHADANGAPNRAAGARWNARNSTARDGTLDYITGNGRGGLGRLGRSHAGHYDRRS
jgi:hypothetical protein